jgi:hypothetical protein
MTEIRKANELMEMVKEYKAKEKERIEKEVNEIVVNIVEEILVPKAKEGENMVFINCGEHRDAVVGMLRENGYICDRCNNEIRVRW